MGKGIILDVNNEMIVHNRTLAIGDSTMQEVAVILGMNQGDQKFVPVLGPNIVQLVKTNASRFNIEQRARIHLAKDNKNYDQIKGLITKKI